MPQVSKPYHRGAKQGVTFSVLTGMGTWGGSRVWSQPRASQEQEQCEEAKRPAGSPSVTAMSPLHPHTPRTLLQQLQKLQTLVTSKISRPYKMAATQTGTCLMVAALCFVLVIGSLVPCLPEFSSSPHTAEEHATADSVYTDSQMPSRSLLFYDEAPSSWEDGRGALLPVEPPEGWEIKPGGAAEQRPQDPLKHNHQDSTHETTKYLGEAWPKDLGANSSSPDFSHPKEWLRERDLGPNTTVQLS